MLIICPECKLQVSDKASVCPHCGYPISQPERPNTARKSNRRRRLPNGFGQISEIKGRSLRKPFRAMVTVGKSETGKPICKLLQPEAYFETYNDAYAALVEYNRSPYDFDKGITVSELYGRWICEYERSAVSKSHLGSVRAAWKYCSSLYDMPVRDVRARHMKGCLMQGYKVIDGVKKSAPDTAKITIKSIFNLMMDYAVEYEIVEHNYARDFSIPNEIRQCAQTVKHSHMAFSDDEISILWKNVNTVRCADMVLVQCYSGWRPQELCSLRTDDVDINNWLFIGGMKTEAGKDRIVPIHSKIRDIIQRAYNIAKENKCEYLFNFQKKDGRWKAYSYDTYRKLFYTAREALCLDPLHRLHDGRTHFVTAAKKNGMDEYAIKYIVGHQISDITEKVYTKRNVEWLREEMEKIV